MKISIHNARFFAHHGYFEEEKLTGNEFIVDVLVTVNDSLQPITDIDDTVNYATLFELVRKEMNTPRKLLETLAMEIVEKIHGKFPHTKEVTFKIRKVNPPIPHFTGEVSIEFSRRYESTT